ncbi:uncharacterized protein LOC107406034 [Ziziphus jujuba]|uniref:Uncharacterized protein LOC107406034 n=1 Tax=Ziziphus jujuba TaxID=326968 RepID=A0A6P3YWB8_ZIZJJ|nr:uncharacterized protein LOC107406034 [Ziziphus jujuba]
MMSTTTTHIIACRPTICGRSTSVPQQKQLFGLKPFNLPRTSLNLSLSAPPPHRRLCIPVLKFKQSATVCLARSGSDNEGSPWKAFGDVMGKFKKDSSIEDVLRQQIEKKEYYPDRSGGGGGGVGGGGSGGSGGGGGGADGSGGSEDEGLAGIADETIQVILATLGFILLYIYIISGEELTRLAKDYIKYLFGGSESVRLKRAMSHWRRLFRRLTEKKETDKYWLEKEIINTPTWWDSPEKYRRISRAYEESNSDQF